MNLINDDCMNVLPSLKDSSVNLIFTDLPYGTTNAKWDSVLPLKELWDEYMRILTPNGNIILTSAGVFTAKLIMSNIEWFKYKIVWVKSKATNYLNVNKQPLRKHEDILVFYDKNPTYNPQMSQGTPYDKGYALRNTDVYNSQKPTHVKNTKGLRHPVDVVYFKTSETEGKVYHPTQKPLSLGEYIIRTYSNPNDLVLDNCMGSGSFILSALSENRRVIGIEIDKEYYETAKKRCSNYQSKLI